MKAAPYTTGKLLMPFGVPYRASRVWIVFAVEPPSPRKPKVAETELRPHCDSRCPQETLRESLVRLFAREWNKRSGWAKQVPRASYGAYRGPGMRMRLSRPPRALLRSSSTAITCMAIIAQSLVSYPQKTLRIPLVAAWRPLPVLAERLHKATPESPLGLTARSNQWADHLDRVKRHAEPSLSRERPERQHLFYVMASVSPDCPSH